MARHKKTRQIQRAPDYGGFIPTGLPREELLTVSLLLDEFESIHLCDYEMLSQEEAARLMNISRPTFTRIYSAARKKIAKVLVEPCELLIEGGKVYSRLEWLSCAGCNIRYSRLDGQPFVCPLCASTDFELLNTL